MLQNFLGLFSFTISNGSFFYIRLAGENRSGSKMAARLWYAVQNSLKWGGKERLRIKNARDEATKLKNKFTSDIYVYHRI